MSDNDIAELIGGELDPATVPAAKGFELVPPGWYNLLIEEAEAKDASTGGKRIALVLQIVGGEHSGRKIFEGLNLVNANPQTELYAFQRLAEIGKALGIKIRGTAQIIDKVVQGKVVIKKDKKHPDREPENQVAFYKAVEGTPAAAAAPAATQDELPQTATLPPVPAATAAPAAKKRPWEK